MKKHIAKTYQVCLSLNNPRTLRLHRDAAIKAGDRDLTTALNLRINLKGQPQHADSNRIHSTSETNRKTANT